MQLLRRRLLSGGTWAFGGKIAIALTGLVSSALLARMLPPQDLGTYFLAYSIVSLGTTLGALGVTETVVRLVAQGMGLDQFRKVRGVVRIVSGVSALGALGVGIAYSLYGHDLAEAVFDAPALAAVSGLVAGWIVVATLQGVLGEIFRGFHDIRLATILGGQTTGAVSGVGTVTLLTASLFVLWVAKGETTLATVLTLAVCAGAVNTLVAGWLVRRKVASLPAQTPDKSKEADYKVLLGDVLSISWPLLVTGLVMFARTNVDIWVLGAFRPQAEVAVYGAANRLVSMVTMPLIIVNAVVPPLIADMYARGSRGELEDTLRGTATLTGIPAALATVVCILFAAPILSLVYGNYYREGAAVLALLSVGVLASVCAGSCGLTLSMTGHQKTLMVITAVSSVVTFTGMILLVVPYGFIGVAVSRMAGQILQNVIMLITVKHKTGMWTHVGFGRLSYLLGHVR